MIGVDGPSYVQKRRRKYLAQAMEAFEEMIEPHLPPGTEEQASTFKGLIRAKFNALAVDATDVMNLTDNAEINGFAIEMKDRLYPNGRPQTQELKNT